jgi:protein-L-isoaspartate(D-aspartate) O-methyltransferase
MVRDQLWSRGIRDRRVLAAMGLVPRESFVAAGREADAYADSPLSIGRGQTISQPYIVARMTESLELPETVGPGSWARPRVLDVGTGSGYQAAILAQMGAEVISIERDTSLAEIARERLQRLGYAVEVVIGDGSLGYAPGAPYQGIVVAAGAPTVPAPLVEQLADGARLVVPVGDGRSQRLTIVHHRGADDETTQTDRCVFVPLVGRFGHPG